MVGKADFPDADWHTLEQGVSDVALLVAVADSSVFDWIKESTVLARHLGEVRNHSPSQLVRDLASLRVAGVSLGAKPHEVEKRAFEALRNAHAVLQVKAPDEIAAYNAFVVGVAECVAEAVSGVAPFERAAILKVKATLESAPKKRARRTRH
jgi:hypothetical protein